MRYMEHGYSHPQHSMASADVRSLARLRRAQDDIQLCILKFSYGQECSSAWSLELYNRGKSQEEFGRADELIPGAVLNGKRESEA